MESPYFAACNGRPGVPFLVRYNGKTQATGSIDDAYMNEAGRIAYIWNVVDAVAGDVEALYLDEHIGNFAVGKEADFVVLDTDAAHITARRAAAAETLDELLFALIFLGDDRNVAATYLLGDRYAG